MPACRHEVCGIASIENTFYASISPSRRSVRSRRCTCSRCSIRSERSTDQVHVVDVVYVACPVAWCAHNMGCRRSSRMRADR
jgi:hypothetical protein